MMPLLLILLAWIIPVIAPFVHYGQAITYRTKATAKQPLFIKVNEDVQFKTTGDKVYIYRFDHVFLIPPPPFMEKGKFEKRQVYSDTVFTVKTEEYVRFSKAELYFVQNDTNSLDGLAFRVVNSTFPKVRLVDDIIEPLFYIMTTKEQEHFRQSQNKKKTLDDFLRQISKNDLVKAQQFMKNYFQRVQEANEQYTSFKPGWKTDKGMLYIVFGKPSSVQRKINEELWVYPDNLKFRLDKRKIVFSKEHYILNREQKYLYIWRQQQGRLRNNLF